MRAFTLYMMVVLLTGILSSCSSGGDGDSNPQNTSNPTTNPGGNSGNPSPTPPGSFALSFPDNNEICQEGAAVADQPDKLLINFKWAISLNADTYRLVVMDADSGEEIANMESSTTDQDVEVNKGKLYQWSVTALNADGETNSPVWSFYSRGDGIGNYVPYPAYNIELIFDAVNDLLSVQWDATDEDGDPLTFGIMLFEDGMEVFSQSDITVTGVSDIPIVQGATYYVNISVNDGLSTTTANSEEVTYP